MTDHDILRIVKRNISRINLIMIEVVNNISLDGDKVEVYPTFRDYFDTVSTSTSYFFLSRYIYPKYEDLLDEERNLFYDYVIGVLVRFHMDFLREKYTHLINT